MTTSNDKTLKIYDLNNLAEINPENYQFQYKSLSCVNVAAFNKD